jgi:hypothetical protein
MSGELSKKNMIRVGLFVLLVTCCSSTFVRLVVLFDIIIMKEGEGYFLLCFI